MPVITLTTDIGENDYIAGAIKGQIITSLPKVKVVDITHNLSPFNYQQTAYICSNAFKHYPPLTFHIVIINLFDTDSREVLIAEHSGQYIACPDNGILTMIVGYKPENVVCIPLSDAVYSGALQYTEAWIHAFNKLTTGKKLTEVGTPTVTIEEKYPLRCTIGTDWMEGQIIFIDNFENVVVNITQKEFEEQRKGRSFKIVFTRSETITLISKNYASAAAGEKLAWFNSAGYLEVAINKGNVAGLFGLHGFAENAAQETVLQNKWFYQTVRIFFE